MSDWSRGVPMRLCAGAVVEGRQRPRPFKGPAFHARQRHSGAPWHPDYGDETEALPGNTLPYQGKSEFDSVLFIDEAIRMSADAPALVGANGNFIVLVEFGHDIGFDAHRNRRTSIATVVTRRSGEVITVFPGRPAFVPIPVLG